MEEIRKRELEKEQERDDLLKQNRCQEGDVYFLSPNKKVSDENNDDRNHFCLELSPEADAKNVMVSTSSITSAITFNSAQYDEMKARNHELEKEIASFKAEKKMLETLNKMLEKNSSKSQQKYDQDRSRLEKEKEQLIIEKTRLEVKLDLSEEPDLNNMKDFQDMMKLRVDGLHDAFGNLRSDQSKKQTDSEYGARLKEMERTNNSLQSSLKGKDATLKSQEVSHEKALAAVQAELEANKAMRAELDARIHEVNQDKEAALVRAEDGSKEVAELMIELANKNEREEELKAQLNGYDHQAEGRNAELEAEVEELCQQNENLEKEMAATRVKLHESEQENVDLETKMELLLSKYQDCMDQIRALEIQFDQSRNESEDLKNAKAEVRAHNYFTCMESLSPQQLDSCSHLSILIA